MSQNSKKTTSTANTAAWTLIQDAYHALKDGVKYTVRQNVMEELRLAMMVPVAPASEEKKTEETPAKASPAAATKKEYSYKTITKTKLQKLFTLIVKEEEKVLALKHTELCHCFAMLCRELGFSKGATPPAFLTGDAALMDAIRAAAPAVRYDITAAYTDQKQDALRAFLDRTLELLGDAYDASKGTMGDVAALPYNYLRTIARFVRKAAHVRKERTKKEKAAPADTKASNDEADASDDESVVTEEETVPEVTEGFLKGLHEHIEQEGEDEVASAPAAEPSSSPPAKLPKKVAA